jgi:hypothetical protein
MIQVILCLEVNGCIVLNHAQITFFCLIKVFTAKLLVLL